MYRLWLCLAFALVAVASAAPSARAATIQCPNGAQESTGYRMCNGTDNEDTITGATPLDDIYSKKGGDTVYVNQDGHAHAIVHSDGGRDTIYADDPGECGDTVRIYYPVQADVCWGDHVYCGGGEDTVYADYDDIVESDCEHVVRGSVP